MPKLRRRRLIRSRDSAPARIAATGVRTVQSQADNRVGGTGRRGRAAPNPPSSLQPGRTLAAGAKPFI
ncbi:YjhX family toxin [Chachezhania sediminis]|uniref:YjhX family toxin n=1 Tax=Chachezhania sediminis TaxID=2599291 RepID=UPI003898F0A0